MTTPLNMVTFWIRISCPTSGITCANKSHIEKNMKVKFGNSRDELLLLKC